MSSKKMQNKTKSNTQGGQNKPQAQKPKKKKEPRLQVVGAAQSRAIVQYSPIEKSGKNGSRTIRYKEYVQDVPGSVAFSATSFACNPGLSNLFAWLSGQGLFYQEYSMKSLKFLFETEKATALGGKVMFAFLQDSSDPLPASKQEMLENLIKASGAIWQPFSLNVGMNNFPALGKSRFVRSGTLSSNLDVKTYDIGQLVVATQGMVDTSDCGELYVEYELELRTPIQSCSQLSTAMSAEVTGATSISATAIYGTEAVITGGLDLTATGNTITFNKVGEYLVDLGIVGTGLFTVFAPTISGTATSKTTIMANVGNAAANVGTFANCHVRVKVTARGQTLILDCDPVATTVTGAVAFVSLSSYDLA